MRDINYTWSRKKDIVKYNKYLATIAILLSIIFAWLFHSITDSPNSLYELLIGILPNFIASLLTFTGLYIYLGPWKESVSNRTIYNQIDSLIKKQASIQKDFTKVEKNIISDVNQFLGFSLGIQKNGLYFSSIHTSYLPSACDCLKVHGSLGSNSKERYISVAWYNRA